MSGQFIPLEKTCDFLSGYAWSAANFEADPVGLPIIRIQNVDAVRDSEFVYWPGEYDERFVVRAGDLLLTLSGSFRAVVWQGPDALLNQRIVKLTPKPGYSLDWLLHVLRNGLNTISGLGRHALVSNVALADLRQLKVPLHTSEEQRRIAAILDQAETLRTQRRQALAYLDTLTQSLFLDMFGDPVANEMGWSELSLAAATSDIQIGPFGSLLHQEDYVPDGIPLINPMHIKDGKIFPGAEQAISKPKYDQLGLYQLRVGDLVMGRRGEMGRCAIVLEDDGPLMCGTGSLFIRPDNTKATADYLYAVLSSVRMKVRLEEFSLGATMPNLNKGIVAGLKLALPPLSLQQTFATRIQAIEALKATHRTALAQLDALFASLQQRAFAGEL